jgi:hypothetical protein
VLHTQAAGEGQSSLTTNADKIGERVIIWQSTTNAYKVTRCCIHKPAALLLSSLTGDAYEIGERVINADTLQIPSK